MCLLSNTTKGLSHLFYQISRAKKRAQTCFKRKMIPYILQSKYGNQQKLFTEVKVRSFHFMKTNLV